MFDKIQNSLTRSFPLLMLGIFYFPCLRNLLIYTKHKDNKMKSWTDLTLYSFPWRRLKSVWIIVAHISGWWDSPLALQSFSWSIAGTPNKKIRHSISPITDLYQIGHNIRIYNPITKRPPGNRTSTSTIDFSLLITWSRIFSRLVHPTTIYT